MVGYALAIDLGGTKVEAALVDDRGVLLPGSRFRAATGGNARSASLEAAVDTVLAGALGAAPAGALAGAGIGSAGPIALDRGLVSPLNLPAWRDYPLRDHVAAALPGLPVVLRTDGEAITLAEHWRGAGRGAASLMGVVVSTGIGGGLILEGRSFSGPTGNAGHFGHVEVGGFEDSCLCGGTGCVEAIASGPATVAWARAQGWTGSTGEELGTDYRLGEAIALAAVRRSADAIGQAIASATALLDLELVAIGGGFSKVTPQFLELVRSSLQRRAAFGFVGKVRVEPTGLGDEGPLIGAAALVHRIG